MAEPEPIILAASLWQDNGMLINDVFKLLAHHLPDNPDVIDLTYGDKGVWWKHSSIAPVVFTGDFTNPKPSTRQLFTNGFDVTTFDGPYALVGGAPKGQDPKFAQAHMEFRRRYGIDPPRTIGDLTTMLQAGAGTAVAFTKPKGFILTKSMPFVTSGKVHWIPDMFNTWMTELGCTKHDELIFLRKRGGPQPVHNRQLTARRNYSVLQVWRKK